MDERIKQIVNHAIIKNGFARQIDQIHEELCELFTAHNHAQRNRTSENIEDVVTEIADVKIMIEQMKSFYDISNKAIEETQMRLAYEKLCSLGVALNTPPSDDVDKLKGIVKTMAEVLTLIEALEHTYDIDDESVNSEIDYKLSRQLDRIRRE